MIRQAAIKDGDQVLDVAAGTGEPGLTVAASIPNGRVTVTDLGAHAAGGERKCQEPGSVEL